MSHENADLPRWQRSSRCVSDHHCVEVALAGNGVLLRSSQRPEDVLPLTRDQWRDFLRMVRAMPSPES
jgi:hypothetical protein